MTSYDAPEAHDADAARASKTADAVSDDEPSSSRPRSKRGGVGRFLRDVLLILLAAIVISFLIKTFLIRSFYIPSESMEPTLVKLDRIIVNELVPDVIPLEHGDVVVFKDPGGWLDPAPVIDQNPVQAFFDGLLSIVGLTAPDSNDHLIKRVIGMPGDHVVCCNEFDQITVNDVPLEEPYIRPNTGLARPEEIFDVTVPDRSLWVMGDNRGNSQDSRFNLNGPTGGFVPYDNVVGRAVLITWPIDRWTWLDNYETVFAGVDDAVAGAPLLTAPPAGDDLTDESAAVAPQVTVGAR